MFSKNFSDFFRICLLLQPLRLSFDGHHRNAASNLFITNKYLKRNCFSSRVSRASLRPNDIFIWTWMSQAGNELTSLVNKPKHFFFKHLRQAKRSQIDEGNFERFIVEAFNDLDGGIVTSHLLSLTSLSLSSEKVFYIAEAIVNLMIIKKWVEKLRYFNKPRRQQINSNSIIWYLPLHL